MKRIVLCLVFSLLIVTSAFAKTTEKNGKIYLSENQEVNLTCTIQDAGVGMDGGLSKFRVRYEADGTFTEWTPIQDYSTNVNLILNVVEGKEFYVQGSFADGLGNWREAPIEVVKSMVLDTSGPSGGTVEIKVTVTITVNQ